MSQGSKSHQISSTKQDIKITAGEMPLPYKTIGVKAAPSLFPPTMRGIGNPIRDTHGLNGNKYEDPYLSFQGQDVLEGRGVKFKRPEPTSDTKTPSPAPKLSTPEQIASLNVRLGMTVAKLQDLTSYLVSSLEASSLSSKFKKTASVILSSLIAPNPLSLGLATLSFLSTQSSKQDTPVPKEHFEFLTDEKHVIIGYEREKELRGLDSFQLNDEEKWTLRILTLQKMIEAHGLLISQGSILTSLLTKTKKVEFDQRVEAYLRATSVLEAVVTEFSSDQGFNSSNELVVSFKTSHKLASQLAEWHKDAEK